MTDLIAHGGAAKEAPENTLSAFRKALEIGVDYIELDVHLSKDGVPVVIHDAVLGRTTDEKHNLMKVADLTYNQLNNLDAGSWFSEEFSGEVIPGLEQVLQLKRKHTGLLVEIKDGDSTIQALSEAVYNCIQLHGSEGIIMGSFSPHILAELHRRDSSLDLAAIVRDISLVHQFKGMGIEKIVLWYPLITPPLLHLLHEDGMRVWAYTVDNPEIVNFLIFIGVDGIITNDPRNIKKLLVH